MHKVTGAFWTLGWRRRTHRHVRFSCKGSHYPELIKALANSVVPPYHCCASQDILTKNWMNVTMICGLEKVEQERMPTIPFPNCSHTGYTGFSWSRRQLAIP